MNKRRVLLSLLLAVMMVLSFAGCTDSTEPVESDQPSDTQDNEADSESGESSDKEVVTIALLLKTLNNPFFISMKDGAEAAALENSVNLIVQAPERETDVADQVQMMEDLIVKKVDAIILSACGPVELIPSIKKANEANIPVLLVNDTVDDDAVADEGASYAAYIGTDNFMGGQQAGSFVAEYLKDGGKVAILQGVPGVVAGDQRIDGFLDKISANTAIEVVATQPANWERDQGYNVFENILTANPDVDLVYAANDMMALGAMEAIEQLGLTGEITVIGFDACDEAKEAIKAGKMTGSVAQYPDDMGRVSVLSALEVISGETIEKSIPTRVELLTIDQL